MSIQRVCKRCGNDEIVVLSRKEAFCDGCFQKFVSAKQRKQMMSNPYCQDVFKVLYQDKVRTSEEADRQNTLSKVLVPLSFGSSSMVLLDILNDTLLEQKLTQRGKTGFQVDVLVCGESEEDLSKFNAVVERLISKRFDVNQEKIKFHSVSVESFYKNCGDDLNTILMNDHSFRSRSVLLGSEVYGVPKVEELIRQCPDKSSRQDLLTVLKTHLIKKFAYQNKHKLILWGHSMTKLADETISLVVKGRGAQVAPLLSNDETHPLFENSFQNLFPLQDVLLSEIDAYCYVKGLEEFLIAYVPQDTLLVEKRRDHDNVPASKTIKNMTLNEIARKYFDDVEADYANVISTVVRTALKLAEPKSTNSNKCSVCHSNVHRDPAAYLQAITVSDSHPIETAEECALYDKWKRTNLDKETVELIEQRDAAYEQGVDSPLCYGCLINLSRMKDHKMTWPKFSQNELNTILDTYELK